MLALFAVAQAQDRAQAAVVLQLSVAQVERYVYQFMVYGLPGVGFKKSSRASGETDGDAKSRTQRTAPGRAASLWLGGRVLAHAAHSGAD
jgi:hypothetical protein